MHNYVTITKALEDTSPLPKLLVSSEEAGWEGIVVSAYREPAEIEWLASGMHYRALVQSAHGAVHLEQRPVNGRWSGQNSCSERPMFHLLGSP